MGQAQPQLKERGVYSPLEPHFQLKVSLLPASVTKLKKSDTSFDIHFVNELSAAPARYAAQILCKAPECRGQMHLEQPLTSSALL